MLIYNNNETVANAVFASMVAAVGKPTVGLHKLITRYLHQSSCLIQASRKPHQRPFLML